MSMVLPVLRQEIPKSASLKATVIKEPRRRQAGEIEFIAQLDNLKAGSLSEKPLALFRGRDLPWLNASKIQAGSKLILKVSCHSIKRTYNPFSYEAMLLRKSISYMCKIHYVAVSAVVQEAFAARIRRAIHTMLIRSIGDSEDLGLFLSMFLGMPDCLSEETETVFKQLGLTHILVVSGYQVTLLYYFVSAALYWLFNLNSRVVLMFPVRIVSELLGLLVSIIYVCMCGLDPAVLRAGIAICLLIAEKCLERGTGFLHAILASLWIVCMISPGAFFEPGTQLTFAALGGIYLGLRRGESIFLQYLKSCIYASVFTSLISVCWFGVFSPAAILLNPIVAAPISALVCKGGIVAIAFLFLGLDWHAELLRFLIFVLHYFKVLAAFIANQPLAYFSCSPMLRVLIALVLCAVIMRLLIKRTVEYLILKDLIPAAEERL